MTVTEEFKNLFYDGIFANMFATLTGGVFLTGFALHLGMNEFTIGLLASIPFMVTAFQLPTSYFVRKSGKRKRVAYFAAGLARLTWIAILIGALVPMAGTSTKHFVILSLIFVSHTFVSVSYVAWLSWTSDLVPDEIRGRFFGTRNMLCGAAGMIVIIVYGNLLDLLKPRPHGLTFGFAFTFVSAVLFGMLSLRYLNRIPEAQVNPVIDNRHFHRHLSLPLKEANFRRFLLFAFLWSFSVYFASPFFTLYFLRDLQFSYGFVAILGMISSFADLTAMQLWGKISDRVKNKAVIQLASWVVVFLPLAWAIVRPGSLVIPILLHAVGGGFWAGINLCMNNLLLRISRQENRTMFLSAYNITGGLGAAAGPILAGLAIKSGSNLTLQFFSWTVLPLQVIFVTSTLFRLLSLQLFKYVHEPEEVTVGQMVRILRSVRGLNMANGFNYLLHPFLEISRSKSESKEP
jgi:MFS family permease